MKTLLATLAATGTLLAAAPAHAQFAKPEDAIKYRQGALFVMGQNFSRIGAMANGRAPFDPKLAAEAAATVEFMSHLPWPAFVEGTDKGSTKARPEVWKESDKFRAAAAKLQEEAAKLNAAARSGNLDQIKAAFGATAQSCKACHDDFRSR